MNTVLLSFTIKQTNEVKIYMYIFKIPVLYLSQVKVIGKPVFESDCIP
jgi:hypothetical protein